jgi:hypothetical protein
MNIHLYHDNGGTFDGTKTTPVRIYDLISLSYCCNKEGKEFIKRILYNFFEENYKDKPNEKIERI